MLDFRSMTAADIERVAKISKDADPFGWSVKNFQDAVAGGYRAEVGIDSEGVIVGYVVVQQVFDEADLLEISVDPAYQGRGYGKELLQLALAQGVLNGARVMHLEVRESNARARKMYENAGFCIDGKRRNYYPCEGGREDAVLMTCELASSPYLKG